MQPSSSASGDLLRFCFRQRESGSSRFLPLQQDETGGSPERVAVRGTQLHVFFADGTHLRLAPVPPDVVQPRSNTFWELKLPDSSVPLAVAGDSVSGVLYAVVPGRVAALLTDEPPDEPDTKNEEPTSAPSVDDASAPDEIQAASEGNQEEASSCWLVRYARGRWWRTCSIPGLADEPGACLLAAEDGVVDLYFSDPGDDLTVYSTQLEGDAWSPVGRVGEVAWSQVAACGITAGQAVLILRHNATLTAVTREPNGWVETDPIPPPPTATAAGPPTLTSSTPPWLALPSSSRGSTNPEHRMPDCGLSPAPSRMSPRQSRP
ncbi:MAG: hypothetical protein GY842_27335 [bacterium]|nr:hypothetical protein [bacterium]